MKANELRIGNWYGWNHEEHESYNQATPEFIQTQHEYDQNPEDDQFSRGWWSFSIPLTEEWLIRFGFERNEWSPINSKAIRIDYYKDSTSIRISLSDDVCKKGVHWFQNWYYFETGEEL